MNIFKKITNELGVDTPLDKIVKERPKSFDMDKLKDAMVVEVNDKVYREQKSLPREFSWIFCFCFAFIFMPIGVFYNTENGIERIVSIIIYIIICVGAGAFPLFAPYKELILNREEGTISMPRAFKKENLVISFEEGEGIVKFTAGGGAAPDVYLVFLHKNRKKGGHLSHSDIYAFWEFVVWYMDKNRPLPPGTAFDLYREADFQRRKAEGFPKPLYKSYIPTPEATRRQQLERERIGKW
ncbi:hypothetical protein [Capnocytophaga gingivalis]|uniref:hypothetical protein n=1 Tax=Capnocytophaga gingivalis TaxID=1017 RepID=UPI0028D17838|nr:hypothetical protein [Capnocytophaga gingivalis]MEB3013744.1 hypothetical protein [Capnocytophaga gingivalis]